WVPTTIPPSPPRCRPAWCVAARRSSEIRSVGGWSACSDRTWCSTSRTTGRAGTPSAVAGRRERAAGLPLLRRDHGAARGPVGRADHHGAVEVHGVQLVLRGPARGLRRRRPYAAVRTASSALKYSCAIAFHRS